LLSSQEEAFFHTREVKILAASIPLVDRIRGNELTLLVLLTLFSVGIRLYLVDSYPAPVFDEIGYIPQGKEIVSRSIIPSSHPPLGMFLISLGGMIWGPTSFGWRFFPVLAGSLCIPLVYFLALRLGQQKGTALAAALLVAFEPMLFAMSRLALLDIFLCFFLLLSAFYLARRQPVPCALSLGCALSVKWLACLIAPVIFLMTALDYHRCLSTRREMLKSLLIYLAIPPLTYLLIWAALFGTADLRAIIDTHRFFIHRMSAVPGTGYLSSPWWSWLLVPQFLPLGEKMLYQDGREMRVILKLVTNPAMSWVGTTALILILIEALREAWQKKVIPMEIPLLYSAFFYFPWALVHRATFVYYMLPAMPFLCLITAYCLHTRLAEGAPSLLGAAFLLFSAISFFMLYPHLVGWLA